MKAAATARLQGALPIAIVSHTHPSVSRGGAEIAAHSLFQGLRSLGVPTVFIAAVPFAERDRLDLRQDEYAVFHDPAHYDHLYQLGQAGVVAQLRAILHQTGARLVNFHHFLHLGANALREVAEDPGIRVVLTLHEFLAICHNHGQMVTRPELNLCAEASGTACGACFPELGWRRFELRRASLADSLAAVDRFIAPSRFLAGRYAAWGLPERRIDIIENGLARPGTAAPHRAAAGRQTWVFGYFGQVTPFKGVDVVVAAAELLARHPDAADRIEIRIHGNIVGPQEEFRRKLAEASARAPFLRILGPYDNGRVLDLMAECDYVLTPSIWWENSPVVIQEAFAAGRPVICSGIGGMAEKVADGVAGLHFRRGDPADLARTILAAADADRHERLRAGLPKPDTIEAMARRYLTSFAAAAAGTPPSRQAPEGRPRASEP